LGNCHATLPAAVRLHRSIALTDNGSAVLAAGAGRRRYGDQLGGHQQDNRSSKDAALHRCLPSHRRWGVAESLGWQIPSTAQPATNDATACATGFVAFEDVIPTIITTMNAKRLAISSTRSAIRDRNRNHKTIYCIGDGKRGLGWVKAAEQTVAPAQQL
jgi:hypothetical protein